MISAVKRGLMIAGFILGSTLLYTLVEEWIQSSWIEERPSQPIAVQDIIEASIRPVRPPDSVLSAPQPTLEAVEPKKVLSATDEAIEFLEEKRNELRLQSYHDLRAEEVENPMGTIVIFRVYQGEIPVADMSIEVRVGKGAAPTELVRSNYRPIRQLEFSSADILSPEEVTTKLKGRVKISEEGLDPVVFVPEGSEEPELVYVVEGIDPRRGQFPAQVIIRASDAEIVGHRYPRKEF